MYDDDCEQCKVVKSAGVGIASGGVRTRTQARGAHVDGARVGTGAMEHHVEGLVRALYGPSCASRGSSGVPLHMYTQKVFEGRKWYCMRMLTSLVGACPPTDGGDRPAAMRTGQEHGEDGAEHGAKSIAVEERAYRLAQARAGHDQRDVLANVLGRLHEAAVVRHGAVSGGQWTTRLVQTLVNIGECRVKGGEGRETVVHDTFSRGTDWFRLQGTQQQDALHASHRRRGQGHSAHGKQGTTEERGKNGQALQLRPPVAMKLPRRAEQVLGEALDVMFVGLGDSGLKLTAPDQPESGTVAKACIAEPALLRALVSVLQGLDTDILSFSETMDAYVVASHVILNRSWIPLVRQISAVGCVCRRLQKVVQKRLAGEGKHHGDPVTAAASHAAGTTGAVSAGGDRAGSGKGGARWSARRKGVVPKNGRVVDALYTFMASCINGLYSTCRGA